MKENKLLQTLKIILPIAIIVIIFILYPLIGLAIIVAISGYLVYKNLSTIYCLMGRSDYVKGNLEKAAAKFEKAYKTGKAKPKFISAYAYILLKLGKTDEAYEILNKIMKYKLPMDVMMHVKSNYALAVWKKGDVEGAIEILEEVLKDYANTTVYGSLGYMYILRGDLDKALEFNLAAYEYNNSNTVILDNLGQTYYSRGEYDKAVEIYEKLMLSKPTFPEAYYNYGLVLEGLNEHEKAIEIMEKALIYRFSYLSTVTKPEIESKLDELKQEFKLIQPQG